jgi:tripartite-type tricarboxylate transporter receptor subunit TctC
MKAFISSVSERPVTMNLNLLRRASLRGLLAVPLAALALAAPLRAPAQTAPIKMVIPFGPGATTDIVGSQVAEALGTVLGGPVVVENKAGAGGTLGSDQVAKALADGRTLLMGTVGTHAINATLFRKLPYDPIKDFVPIGFVGYTPTLVVVAAGSPIKTLADLKAAAQTAAGVSFASSGTGTSGHLAGELLATRWASAAGGATGGAGSKMVHVPYSQGGQALTDVISGQVQFMFYHPAAVMQHIQAGKLRALGASGAKRSAAAPEVATLQELGVPEFDLVAWFMVYAAANTPPAEVARLREAFARAMALPSMVARLTEQGVETRAIAHNELNAFGAGEIKRWSEAVKRSGAQID